MIKIQPKYKLDDGSGDNRRPVDALLPAYEKEIVSNYRESLKTIKGELNRIYAKYSTDGFLTYAEMSRYNRYTALLKDVNGILNDMNVQTTGILKKLPPEAFQESFYQHAYYIDRQVNFAVNYGLLNPETIKASIENPLSHIAIQDMKNSVIIGVKRDITQALIQGKSYFKLAQDIKHRLEVSGSRALMIARTEGGRANSQGQLQAYDTAEVNGVSIVKRWVSTLDGRTRSTHQHIDGQKADKNGYFTFTSGVKTKAPHMSGVASEDIHCRCRLIAEVEEYKPTKRRVKGEGVTEYQTYDEWKDKKIKKK